MSIVKLDDGRWLVDVEPVKGRRYRRKFKTKADAVRFESKVRVDVTVDSPMKPKVDDRSLLELIELWYGHHGLHLADPERRKRSLIALSAAMSNPIARLVSPTVYLNYRQSRAFSGSLQKP